MQRSGSFILAVSCLVLLLGSSVSAAEELAKQGSFEVTIQQDGSWEGFPVAQSYWVWIARRQGDYLGTGPLNGMTSKCVSKGRTAHGISTAEIHCENSDPDGDKIFEFSKEECACAPGGKGGTGTGEFLGGTGKFVGIRGTFEIERKVGARDQAARTWTDYVTIVGSWTLP